MNQRRDAFFRELYQGCDGLVELRALPSTERQFLEIDDVAGMEGFLADHRHENCFNGIATRRSTASGKLENCLHLPALWADIDFKDTPEDDARKRVAEAPVRPSATIQSGGGLHLYWLMKECVELSRAAEVKAILKRLPSYFKADYQSAELARVLRSPGSLSYKYDPPRLVTLEQFNPGRVNFSDFDEWLPPLSESQRVVEARAPLGSPIPVGQRERTLMRVLGGARRCGASEAGLRVLAETENRNCTVPLTAHDLDRMARSVAGYDPDDLDIDALVRTVKQQQAARTDHRDRHAPCRQRDHTETRPVDLARSDRARDARDARWPRRDR